MVKKDFKVLYVLVMVLIITQIIIIIFLIYQTSNLKSSLESATTSLEKKINENKINLQNTEIELRTEIKSLSGNLSSIQTDFQEEINMIKATTSEDFSGIIETAFQSVVSIKTNVAQGSGFIVNEQGYIVTNAHVLSGARYAQITTYDTKTRFASLIGQNINMDISLLKINENYPALELENSENIKVGAKVIALGNPLGLSFTATEGIVSAIDRTGPNELEAYIQTDVSLNPGNSGGPLINKQGKVIGINNFKISNAEGLGFALESDYIKQTINNIANQTII